MNTPTPHPRWKTGLHAVGIAAVLALGLAATAAAEAHPRGGVRVGVGVWMGGPMWWGGYGYPYGHGYGWGGYPYGYGYGYGYPQTVIVHQQPAQPVVVAPSAAQQANTWYYCRDAQMYYPHVTSCPSPWQEVTPPGAAPPAEPNPETTPPARSAPAPVPPAR